MGEAEQSLCPKSDYFGDMVWCFGRRRRLAKAHRRLAPAKQKRTKTLGKAHLSNRRGGADSLIFVRRLYIYTRWYQVLGAVL